MSARQTEKITALYERLSRDDESLGTVIRSSIKNDTWRAMPLTTVTVISSITRMTDGLAAILTVPHGNG